MGRRHAFDWFRSVVLLSVLCAAAADMAWGQGGRGGITGIVADSTGAVVPGATVTATNLDTGFARETISGGDGSFLFALLDVGRYRIEVVAKGFKKLTREPIVVRVTETADLRQLVLEVGAVTESVNVTGEAPVLQTTAPTMGKVFDSNMVNNLPLVTRNFTQLLTLQPGVVSEIPNGASLGTGTQGFSVGGGRYYDNSILIDGINAVATALGGSYIVAVPAPDSVQEFKVQTQLYSAEYGRAGGSSVNLVTKSGTNQLHGDVYEFFRNNVLNANDFFYKASQLQNIGINKAPILRQNQFGGTIGGPIRKDKTFFFFSYEGTRQLNGVSGTFTDPSYPLIPAGDRSNTASFRAALGAIYGGRTGFPFGICELNINCILPDGSNINPAAIKILQAQLPNGQYVLPSFPQSSFNDGAGGLNGGQVYSTGSFSTPATYNDNQYMINIDHQISSRQTFSGKFFSSGGNATLPTGALPSFTVTTTPQNRNLMLTHTFTLSPTLVNEVRAGYVRIGGATIRHDPLSASDVGMKPAPDAGKYFPRLIIALSGLDIGGASSNHNTSLENQFTISDTVSKVLGKHSFRFGGTLVRHQLSEDQDFYAAGLIIIFGFQDFLIGQDAAGNGLASIGVPISNLLTSAGCTGSFEKSYRFNDFSYFFQDDIKVRPNFTLNLGLRWDFFAWPHDIRGRMGSFEKRRIGEGLFGIPSPAQAYTGFTLARQFVELNPTVTIPPGVALVNNIMVDGEDYRSYGPCIGFAWEPFKRWAVRAGYGIFFPRTSSVAANQESVGPPFNSTSLTAFTPYGTLDDPFTYLNLPPDSAFPIWSPRQYIPGQSAGYFNQTMAPWARNPSVQQWNLSVQHEFGNNYLLEIAYMGSHGVKLLNAMAENQPGIASPSNPIRGVTTNTPANTSDRVPVAGVLPDRGLGGNQMSAASKYNALLISMNKRWSHGLQFLSAFTFSKSTDTNSLNSTDSGLNGNPSNAQPPGDNTFNNHWGLSVWDRKVRSTTSFVYALPNLMKNRGALLKKGFGGWQTSAVMTFQSGTPITFLIQPTYSAVKTQGFLTPNLAPGKTLADVQGSGPTESRLNNYFATPGLGKPGSAFVLPGPLDYGQLGRTLPIRTPGQKCVDFSLSKRTPIHEQINLEFRAEFFNFFNWVSFGGPNSVPDSPTFGYIRSTTVAPRIIQFALKLNF